MTSPRVRKAALAVGVTRRPSAKAMVLILASYGLPVIVGASLAAAVLLSPAFLAVAVLTGGLWLWVDTKRRRRRQRAANPTVAVSSAVGTKSRGSLGKGVTSQDSDGRFAEALIQGAGPDNPLVTVVVPLHNKQQYIADCLDSLLKQSFPHWRCVIVEDGSTDNSLDIARGIADEDPRFEVVIRPTAGGLSRARNAGIEATTTPYVTLLDADDALLPDSLLARLRALTEDPMQAGSYSLWASFDSGADWRRMTVAPPTSSAVKDYITMGWDSPCIVTAPLMRTAAVRACGAFDPELVAGEDMDFFGRLLRAGFYLSPSGSRDVLYRTVPGSLLLANADVHWSTVKQIAEWRDATWEPWTGAPSPFPEPLSDYRRDAELMDRAIGNLAIALATGCTDQQLAWWREEFAKFAAPLRRRESVPAVARRSAQSGLGRTSGGERPTKERVGELTTEMLEVIRWDLPQRPSEGAAMPEPDPMRALAAEGYTPSPKVELRSLAEVDTSAPLVLVQADARYHVYETGPLVQELRRRGINAAPFMQRATYSDLRQLIDWSRYVDVVYTDTEEVLAETEVFGAVVLNDWSKSARTLMDATKRAGGLTFAKVEGVQDFQDADTGRERLAYQRADVILAQGINDVEALPGMDVEIVGGSRLEQIWAEPPVARRSDRVLLNVNFTYGVLTDAFRGWVDTAVDVLDSEQMAGDISAHWAQKDMPKDPRVASLVRPEPFRYLISRAGVLVSRFSTVPFEAMARGVPFVYFNPHGERVPTFTQPNGAFEIVTDPAALGKVLRDELAFEGDYRARSAAFFARQVDIDVDRSSAERAADVICKRLGLPG